MDPYQFGTFVVVLFLGVLYQLKDPFAGLEKATSMSHDLLVVETATPHNYTDEPLMRYYIGAEMNDDDTNYWAPNLACLQAMLRDLGSRDHEFIDVVRLPLSQTLDLIASGEIQDVKSIAALLLAMRLLGDN